MSCNLNHQQKLFLIRVGRSADLIAEMASELVSNGREEDLCS